jgi:hypothetical protein
MKDKKQKTMDEIETISAAITFGVVAGLVSINLLVLMIPDELIRNILFISELVILSVAGYIAFKAFEEIVDRNR